MSYGDERKRTIEDASKSSDVIETEVGMAALGKVQKEPAYWLDGNRSKDGVNIAQALIRNWRTYTSDEKGNTTSNRNYEGKIPMRSIEAEQFVVAMKPL